MYVCMHIDDLYACLNTCITVYRYTGDDLYIHTYIHTCIHTYMHTYINAYINYIATNGVSILHIVVHKC